MRKCKKYSLTLDEKLINKIIRKCDKDIPLSRVIERYLRKGLEADN